MSRLTALALLAGAAVALATGSGASRAAAPARTGTIGFIRVVPGPVFGGRLFVIRADASGLRRVTPRNTVVYAYAWSPDGRLIAYIDAQTLSLWLVRPDGTGRRLLLPSSQLSTMGLSWSPDGKNIAIVSAGAGATLRSANAAKLALYVVPVNGTTPVPLPAGRHVGWDVAWSPLGGEIGYEGDGAISVIRPDGSGRRQVALGGGVQWSADGAQLAFGARIRLRNGNTDRYRAFGVANADGTGYHVVTTHAYNEYGVAWAPSGHRILYGRADRKGIYLIGSDGRGNRRVTQDSPPEAGWGALAWSPDGRSIVYDTGGYKNTDIYVIGVDGRGKVQLTSSPDIDIAPSWVAR